MAARKSRMDIRSLFDENVTLNKLREYLSHDDDSTRTHDTYAEMEKGVFEILTNNRSNLLEAQADENVTLNKLEESLNHDDDSAETQDTSAEVEKEFQSLLKILAKTQSNLLEAQAKLKDKNGKTQILGAQLQAKELEILNLRNEFSKLSLSEARVKDDVKKLKQEIQDRDGGLVRSVSEQRLRKAVELLKKDLEKARKKHLVAQEKVQTRIKENEQLKEVNQQQKDRISEMEKFSNDLLTTHGQLRGAKEEATRLVEEVASLQEENSRLQQLSKEQESKIRDEITRKMKDKIRLEVRESVTTEIMERVTREVTEEMNAERTKEIDALTEQFNEVLKESTTLKVALRDSKETTKENMRLEKKISDLKYEVSSLQFLLDQAKREKELQISELESSFRRRINDIKEEAEKEKWACTSDMRTQFSKERETEVTEYVARFEALSKETNRLLQRAEHEKEVYAEEVKRRAAEQMKVDLEKFKNEILKLRRKNLNLTTLVEHYEADYNESLAELRQSKDRFQEVVSNSEEQNQKMKDALEKDMNDLKRFSKGVYINVEDSSVGKAYLVKLEAQNVKLRARVRDLEYLRNQYENATKASDEEVYKLSEQNQSLRLLLAHMVNHDCKNIETSELGDQIDIDEFQRSSSEGITRVGCLIGEKEERVAWDDSGLRIRSSLEKNVTWRNINGDSSNKGIDENGTNGEERLDSVVPRPECKAVDKQSESAVSNETRQSPNVQGKLSDLAEARDVSPTIGPDNDRRLVNEAAKAILSQLRVDMAGRISKAGAPDSSSIDMNLPALDEDKPVSERKKSGVFLALEKSALRSWSQKDLQNFRKKRMPRKERLEFLEERLE